MENLPARNSTIRSQFRSASTRLLTVTVGKQRKRGCYLGKWKSVKAALTCGNEGKRDAADTREYQRCTQRRSSTESVHSEVEDDVSREFDQCHQDEVGELVAVHRHRSERESIEHECDGDPVCWCWLRVCKRDKGQ